MLSIFQRIWIVATRHLRPVADLPQDILQRSLEKNRDDREDHVMKVDLNKLKVTRNEAENTFEVQIDGHLSKLDYFQDDKNFVITHVGVYPEFRGQGVAGKIMEAALEYAKQHSLRVVPMCSYAATYIRKNPQYRELTNQERSE
jgi:hypothetical protein